MNMELVLILLLVFGAGFFLGWLKGLHSMFKLSSEYIARRYGT